MRTKEEAILEFKKELKQTFKSMKQLKKDTSFLEILQFATEHGDKLEGLRVELGLNKNETNLDQIFDEFKNEEESKKTGPSPEERNRRKRELMQETLILREKLISLRALGVNPIESMRIIWENMEKIAACFLEKTSDSWTTTDQEEMLKELKEEIKNLQW